MQGKHEAYECEGRCGAGGADRRAPLMTSHAAAVVSADRFCPSCMCCKSGMTDGSIGRSPPSLIRAKQSCIRHHASVRLRVRHTCMLSVRESVSVRVHKCEACAHSPSGLLPEAPAEGSSVEAHWHVSRRTINLSCSVVHTRARRPCSETCAVPATGVQHLLIGSGWRGWMAERCRSARAHTRFLTGRTKGRAL